MILPVLHFIFYWFQHSMFYKDFNLFIYLGFYVAFNTVQVISQQVVGRAEETSTYSLSGFCTVNCRPTASNYQLSHLRPCWGSNPGLRGGRQECYHSATVAPYKDFKYTLYILLDSIFHVLNVFVRNPLPLTKSMWTWRYEDQTMSYDCLTWSQVSVAVRVS